jgi:hypothetical protein
VIENPAWFVGLLLVLAIPSRASDPTPPGRVLELRVAERNGGRPVAGAAVLARSGRKPGPEWRGTKNDQGSCPVPIPPDATESHHFAVHAWKDGFVPVGILWGSERQFKFEGVPASYTVVLDRGTPIGGVVRDERGAG